MIEGIASFYLPGYACTLIYMLQRTEYQPRPYLSWYWRTSNFQKVTKRGKLVRTLKARLLLALLRLGILIQFLVGVFLIYRGIVDNIMGMWSIGICAIISYPIIWAFLITVPLLLAKWLIIMPRDRVLITRSTAIFAKHKAIKVAVAGSYGKTTMKEILAVVLRSEHKKVAITPANKNVSVSHAIFAKNLKGDEDILVIEYGEGRPGDVAQFAKTTHPSLGVITGIAPAHLDHYPTLESAGRDIFSLADYLHNKKVYVNGDSQAAKSFIKPAHHVYGHGGVGKWQAKDIKVSYQGLAFVLENGKQKIKIESQLLGRHQVGPLSAAVVIALDLGISQLEIEANVKLTKSFDHRMQSRSIAGAWVIDDTYNGNIEGIKAGLELMHELPAKRKIYVTPGLVDQGVETVAVHTNIGQLIAKASPDIVVLMKNSVTDMIAEGLKSGGYVGQLRIESDPLNFYTNLDQFLAAGDLLIMQNDWPDNYY